MGLSLFLRGLDENDTFILKPIPEYESAYKRTKDPELDRRKPNHIEQASKNQYRAFLAKWFSGLSVFVQACAICYCSLVREEHNRILQMYEDFANRTNPTNDTDNNLKEKITTLKERADIINDFVKKRVQSMAFCFALICYGSRSQGDPLSEMTHITKDLKKILMK